MNFSVKYFLYIFIQYILFILHSNRKENPTAQRRRKAGKDNVVCGIGGTPTDSQWLWSGELSDRGDARNRQVFVHLVSLFDLNPI